MNEREAEWNAGGRQRTIFTEDDAKMLRSMGIAPIDVPASGNLSEFGESIADSFEQLSPDEQELARNQMYERTTDKERLRCTGRGEPLTAADIEWLLDLNAYDFEENSCSMWFQHLIRRRVLRGAPFAYEHEERIRAMKVGYPW